MIVLKVLFLLAGLFCTPTEASDNQLKKSEEFQFLLLAHFWPTSSCVYFANEGKECLVPKEVKGWTIHGLWPSIPGEEKPDYCNSSMKFNYEEIKSLSQRLAVNWPCYEKDASKTELWDHEWTKHGTCAYPLPVLRGELRYFNQTLNLHDKLNIRKILGDSGIVPSDEAQYLPQDFFDALKKATGKIPDITCVYDKTTHHHHVEQIWLCYDKQLQPKDCPGVAVSSRLTSTLYFESMREQGAAISPNSYFQGCPKSGKIFYKPLPRDLV